MSRRACAAMSAAPRSGEFLVFIKPKTYASFGPDQKRLFLINFIKSDLRDQAAPVAKGLLVLNPCLGFWNSCFICGVVVPADFFLP